MNEKQYTVSTQDYNGVWEQQSFDSKQEVWDYITSLDAVSAVEIEGVEQDSKVISVEELEAWFNS